MISLHWLGLASCYVPHSAAPLSCYATSFRMLQIARAGISQLDAAELREQQRSWKASEKHRQRQQLHTHTRIILDADGAIVADRSHIPLSPFTSPPPDDSKSLLSQPGRTQSASSPSLLLSARLATMRQQMLAEVRVLRQLIAAPSAAQPTVSEQQLAEDASLPPVASPLLGLFSPHLVSSQLPCLHSWPQFHFLHDALQPHIACCYTLNQAHQLLHVIAKSLPTPSSLADVSFAYVIGTGVGRLRDSSDGAVAGSGERLLYQLRQRSMTNVLLLVMRQPGTGRGRQTAGVGAAGLEADERIAHERLRLVVQVAKLVMQAHSQCVDELVQDMRDGRQDATTAAATQQTFLTQAAEEEKTDELHAAPPCHLSIARVGDVSASTAATTATLPPAFFPHLHHSRRSNHCMTVAATRAAASVSQPLSPSQRAVSPSLPAVWTLETLREELLSIVSPSSAVFSLSPSQFVLSSSLLCKRFHLTPALPQEAPLLLSSALHDKLLQWEEEGSAQHQREGMVGGWEQVQEALWAVYVVRMKWLHAQWERQAAQAEAERLGRQPYAHARWRLLMAAVGAVLGWQDVSWSDTVAPHICGLRAVPPCDIFAEFPPPPASDTSPAFAASAVDSPYAHRQVLTNPLLLSLPAASPASSDPPSPSTASSPALPAGPTAASSAAAVQLPASLLCRYGWYRTDLFAQLLTAPLFSIREATLQTLYSVLSEQCLQNAAINDVCSEQSSLLRLLVDWLLLLLRCQRLWTLCQQQLQVGAVRPRKAEIEEQQPLADDCEEQEEEEEERGWEVDTDEDD